MNLLDRRIGRLGYLLGQIPVLLFIVILSATTGSTEVSLGHTPAIVAVPAIAIALWDLVLTAWRCHDFNQSLWSNFWTEQIPFVGPLLGLWDVITTPGSK